MNNITTEEEHREEITIECDCCKKPFVTYRTKGGVMAHLNQVFDPKRCDQCEDEWWITRDAEIARREAEKKAKDRAGWIGWAISELHDQGVHRLRNTDTAHPGWNARAWPRVERWTPSEEKPWLYLQSETGRCKSRMAYLLTRKLIEEFVNTFDRKPSVGFISAYHIAGLVGDQFGGKGFNMEARNELKELLKDDILVIDDFGKGALSPRVAQEFFAILDHRHNRNLCTIITANSSPQDIAAKLEPDLAGPLAGRITECAVILKLA